MLAKKPRTISEKKMKCDQSIKTQKDNEKLLRLQSKFSKKQ